MIIDSVRNFIKECPHIADFHKGINIDYLNEDATSYSIISVPSDPILKKYINGDTERQLLFVFASREYYSNEVFQNLENIGFYEKFSEWMEHQSSIGILPVLDEGKFAKKLEAITTGYAFDAEMDKCQYQIQCRLLYCQKN